MTWKNITQKNMILSSFIQPYAATFPLQQLTVTPSIRIQAEWNNSLYVLNISIFGWAISLISASDCYKIPSAPSQLEYLISAWPRKKNGWIKIVANSSVGELSHQAQLPCWNLTMLVADAVYLAAAIYMCVVLTYNAVALIRFWSLSNLKFRFFHGTSRGDKGRVFISEA